MFSKGLPSFQIFFDVFFQVLKTFDKQIDVFGMLKGTSGQIIQAVFSARFVLVGSSGCVLFVHCGSSPDPAAFSE